jgi:hypothetical protein
MHTAFLEASDEIRLMMATGIGNILFAAGKCFRDHVPVQGVPS